MPGQKTLINRTGNELKVTLVVRKGDQPSQTAGTVDVVLPASRDEGAGEDASVQKVTYGDDVDIYLNGLDLTMPTDGGDEVIQRRIVIDRGSKLDNILNMNDTIEFRYDGKAVLFTASNADQVKPMFQFGPPPGA